MAQRKSEFSNLSPAMVLSRRSLAAGIIGCCSVCAVNRAKGQLPRTFIPIAPQGVIACGSEPGTSGTFEPEACRILSRSGTKQIDDGFLVERRFLDYFFGFSGSDGTRDFGRPDFHFYDDSNLRIGARAFKRKVS